MQPVNILTPQVTMVNQNNKKQNGRHVFPAVASYFAPGTGQLLNGEPKKALVYAGVAAAGAGLGLLSVKKGEAAMRNAAENFLESLFATDLALKLKYAKSKLKPATVAKKIKKELETASVELKKTAEKAIQDGENLVDLGKVGVFAASATGFVSAVDAYRSNKED